jgi:hypothetical protein
MTNLHNINLLLLLDIIYFFLRFHYLRRPAHYLSFLIDLRCFSLDKLELIKLGMVET